MNQVLSNRQILRATLIVLLGFLASGVLGLIRLFILSAQFGTSEAMDAFVAAQRIPEFVFVVVAGGALGSSFIPVYARIRDDDQEQAWKMASAVTTLVALVAAILGIVIAIFAPWLVSNFLRPESSAEVQTLTTNMMRLMMVTPFIFSISGLVMGILQSHQLFLLPSIAISMNNIGIMVGALVIAPLLPADEGIAQIGNANIYGLAIGAILSAILHLVVQLPGLRQIQANLRPLFNWHIEGVGEVLRLMGPRVLGLSVVQINFVVNIILTDAMLEGSLVALNTAFTLMFFIIGLIGQSVGSAVFPSLSALVAKNDLDGFKLRLASAIRNVIFLSFPATIALILLGEPLVSLFERGAWTQASTIATAWALSFYAIGIVGFTLLEVLSRAFYSLSDTWTPVLIGLGAMISNIILSLILVQFIGDPDDFLHGPFAGLALANASTTLVESAILWWILRRRIGHQGKIDGIADASIFEAMWKAGVASLIMGFILWLGINWLDSFSSIWILMFSGIVGGIIFFVMGYILGLREAKAIPMLFMQRLKRT